jgi:Protein of unknwon function (DUF3310)
MSNEESHDEQVSHPAHYGGADNPYEVIKVMEAWLTPQEFVGALKFNIHKYFARADKKGGAADYKKGVWYAAYLRDYLARTPSMGKVDGAVARQLNKSMELNARIKNEVRAIRDDARWRGEHLIDARGLQHALDDILRMG